MAKKTGGPEKPTSHIDDTKPMSGKAEEKSPKKVRPTPSMPRAKPLVGAGHPNVALETCLSQVAAFWKEGGENRELSNNAFARILGYKSAGSGGFHQKRSALVQYGLLVGSSPGRTKITDLGLQIVLSNDVPTAIRAAALKPSLAQEVRRRYPNRLPDIRHLVIELVTEWRLKESTAQKSAQTLVRNWNFAKADEAVGSDNPVTTTPVTDQPVSIPGAQQQPDMRGADVREHEWIRGGLGGGHYYVVRATKELDDAAKLRIIRGVQANLEETSAA